MNICSTCGVKGNICPYSQVNFSEREEFVPTTQMIGYMKTVNYLKEQNLNTVDSHYLEVKGTL